MAIDEGDINRAWQGLAGGDIPWRCAGRLKVVSRNREAVHADIAIRCGIQISGWPVRRRWPTVHPNRIRKIRRQSRMRDAGLLQKKLALGPETLLVTIAIAPAIETVASDPDVIRHHAIGIPQPRIIRCAPSRGVAARSLPTGNWVGGWGCRA